MIGPAMAWRQTGDRSQGFDDVLDCYTYVIDQERQMSQDLLRLGGNRRLVLKLIDGFNFDDLLDQDQKVLITNVWVKTGIFPGTVYEKFPDSWYGMYAGHPPYSINEVRYDYNCFINRMDPVRQSWFYQLIRRDLLPRGAVSFNMDVSRHHQSEMSTGSTSHAVFEHQFDQHLQSFAVEHDVARLIVPYRNFDIDANLNDIIMSSKFSLVLETYFDRNEIITFSEKIFRCLKLPRPWILFTTQHGVKYLRDMGFDVLDDVVDHSYDDIEFSIDRQSRMLDICQEMCDINLDHAMMSRLESAAEHNRRLLGSLRSKWKQDIDLTFHRARQKCLG